MRHVSAYPRDIFSFGQARPGVVQRLIESESSFAAGLGEPFKIFNRGGRFNHGSQRGRVWSDHEVFAQTALKTETRDAKTGILIGEIHIPGVVSGLRNPPRHAAFVAVL